MSINFFQKELRKVQDRFNETFGMMTVCDLKTRQLVILSIISLGRLCEKIDTAGKRDQETIKTFMRTREIINRTFEQIERRQHANNNANGCQGPDVYAIRNVG